ncbi:MAG: beta-lactamase family protein [Candidatus Dormibacteraeota bacterium]|nr:beta-lactamase family protein [Candidatus Dormibacteraeota bacterium]
MAGADGPRLGGLHDQLVERLVEGAERLKVPGVAVGIFHDGEEDFAFHGVTSIDNPLEVNRDTFFQIGSTTKTYTATAAVILAERGRLDLAAPVRRYVPELRLKDESVAEAVTVFQLLNHTAGWLGDVFTDTGEGDDYLEKYVAGLVSVDQMNPLGSAASYNNAAFVLAGLVIQRASGVRYEDAIRELIFEPLHMAQSMFNPRDVMTRRFAVGHNERQDVLKVATPWALPRSANPPGGILSIASDQMIYARFHLGDGTAPDGTRLLPADALRRMQAPTAELRGGALGDHVGISWLLRDVGGTRVVAHGGSTNGQQSAFELVPSRNFGLTLLTNADRGAVLNRELTEWILEAYLGLADAREETIQLGPAEMAAFAGEYDNRNAIVSVSVEGDTLVLRASYTEAGKAQVLAVMGEGAPDPPPMTVKLLANDRYMVSEGDAKGMKGIFVRDDSGRVTALELGGRLAQKIG